MSKRTLPMSDRFWMMSVIISLLLLLISSVEAKKNSDLQWKRIQGKSTQAQSVVVLRRIKGDALAIRQRIDSLAESKTLLTELSHLTGGCQLNLHWTLPKGEPNALSHDVSEPQLGPKQVAQALTNANWPQDAQRHSLRFSLTLPQNTHLTELNWLGCSWGTSIQDDKQSQKRDETQEQSLKLKNKVRPTLPNGAKSSRAIGVKALLGNAKEKTSKPEITVKLQGKKLLLTSQHSAFTLMIESSQAVSPFDKGWSWAAESEGTQAKPLTLNITLVHAFQPLTPIESFNKTFKPASQHLHDWLNLIDFLSYQEGMIDGLGEQAITRSWASLLFMSTLPEEYLPQLSAEWCEAALMGALKELPAWPHVFKAYLRPMKPLDGRLLLPIALAQYLFKHPQGQKRAESFLRTKFKGIMLASIVKRHLQDLIGRASFFANRPAKRYLIATDSKHVDELAEESQKSSNKTWTKTTDAQLSYGYAESAVLMPKALKATEQLLSAEGVKATLGAPIGLDLRTAKLQAVWNEKARGFFERQIEVYEARARIENWGRFLELPDPETPSLTVKANIKYYTAQFDEATPKLDAWVALDLLWGEQDHLVLTTMLNTARPFPAGLVSPQGVLLEHDLPFTQELAPLKSTTFIPSTAMAAVWLLALKRQLKRKWPYKLIIKLEDAQQAIWQGLIGEAQELNSDSTQDKKVLSLDSWQQPSLSLFDALALFIAEPPPIEARSNVDSRELR